MGTPHHLDGLDRGENEFPQISLIPASRFLTFLTAADAAAVLGDWS